MLDVDDSALAQRIAASPQDAEAEAELVRRFGHRVRLYGLRHLRDEAAADDLAQEVLVLTITRLRQGGLRDPTMLASFVLGSCRFVVRNQRRTERRRSERLEQFPHDVPKPGEAATSGDASSRERLAACLAKLGERDRAVIVLTFYAERDSGQIADELGLSPGNVRVVRHRALAQLFTCVNEKEAA